MSHEFWINRAIFIGAIAQKVLKLVFFRFLREIQACYFNFFLYQIVKHLFLHLQCEFEKIRVIALGATVKKVLKRSVFLPFGGHVRMLLNFFLNMLQTTFYFTYLKGFRNFESNPQELESKKFYKTGFLGLLSMKYCVFELFDRRNEFLLPFYYPECWQSMLLPSKKWEFDPKKH